MIIRDTLLRPFRTPFRLLAWILVALIPLFNLLLLGLNINCLRTAEQGIPPVRLLRLLKDTLIAVLIILIIAAPAVIILLLLQTILSQLTVVTGLVVIILFVTMLLAAYLIPAAFVLYARNVFPTPHRVLAIARQWQYTRLWLIAICLNATTALTTTYANANLGVITAYIIVATLLAINQVWLGTIFSFTDTTLFETGGTDA